MVSKKVMAGILFRATAFLSLLPFVILSFFSHPGMEDYLLKPQYTQGFWELQKYSYQYWSGRFLTNFINTCWIKMGFVYHAYFLHTLLLFLFTGVAVYCTLSNINRVVLNNCFSISRLLEASFIFLLLNIYLLADIPSNFYWFSAVFVYQIPIMLLLVLITLLLKRLNQVRTKKIMTDIAISIIILLIIGCNETMAVSIIVLLFSAWICAAWQKLPERKMLSVFFLIALVAGCIVFISSGILNRQKLMNANTGYTYILPIILFRVFMVFYNIFKEPIFWVSLAFCVVSGAANAAHAKYLNRLQLFFNSPKKIGAAAGFSVLLAGAILTPLLIVSRGSFPDRALNNIIIIIAIFLLVVAFLAGHLIPQPVVHSLNGKIPGYTPIIILCAAMILNVGYINAWKSVCSGYFYHRIMLDRDKQLEDAKMSNLKTVTMPSYQQALQEQINKRFPKGVFKSLADLLEQPPVTIPFFNEADDSTQKRYLNYYGVEKIIIQPDNP